MKKLLVGIVVPLTASVGLWLGLTSSAAHAKTAKPQNRPAAVRVSNETTTTPDTDNVQEGDQTTPDSPATLAASVAKSGTAKQGTSGGNDENQGEGENQGENEGNSDGSGGHQDPPGNVNHECDGNCQE